MNYIKTYEQLKEDNGYSASGGGKLKHEVTLPNNWKIYLQGNPYAQAVLNTVLTKQGGMASDRQWEILQRAKRGDKGPYHPKN